MLGKFVWNMECGLRAVGLPERLQKRAGGGRYGRGPACEGKAQDMEGRGTLLMLHEQAQKICSITHDL